MPHLLDNQNNLRQCPHGAVEICVEVPTCSGMMQTCSPLATIFQNWSFEMVKHHLARQADR